VRDARDRGRGDATRAIDRETRLDGNANRWIDRERNALEIARDARRLTTDARRRDA